MSIKEEDAGLLLMADGWWLMAGDVYQVAAMVSLL